MAIHFSKARMKRVLESHELWWDGRLKRPLVRLTLTDAYPKERHADAPLLSQASCADFTYAPEALIEALDAELSQYEFLGDSFPMVNFDAFGPGVLAAMCGAKLDNSSGRVWLFPPAEAEIADIHIQYDPENIWSRRIKDIYKAGLERWDGLVLLGFPDLGGVLDVAATFRGSANLLIDMVDEPQEVVRLAMEAEMAWREAYEDFRSELLPQGAYTHWSGLMSSGTSYIVQCDISYMISNRMFRSFVLDTLRRDAETLDKTIYHLDGVGELNHLDSVLSIEKLNAVQWQFGDGKPSAPHWLDIYRRILDAGKQIKIEGAPRDYLETLGALHGTPYYAYGLPASQKDLAHRLVEAR